MLSRIVLVFLIFILVLGMFGKWRRKLIGRLTGKTPQARIGRPRKCPECGKFLVGSGPCSCGRG
jgi:hypothetical protein